MSNLEPCPFCGDVGRAVITSDEIHYVKCYGCGADGPYSSTEISAMAAWNRRASPWRDSQKEPPPKDGKIIAIGRSGMVEIVRWCVRREHWIDMGGIHSDVPLHWMPIPPLERS